MMSLAQCGRSDCDNQSAEAFMISHLEKCKEAAQHERAINALTERTGAPRAEVGALFATEFARLAQRATVRSYLVTRTVSNVLAALRQKPTQSTQ
jgi:hypothetical protein